MCTSAYSFTRDQQDYTILKGLETKPTHHAIEREPYFHKYNDLENKPLQNLKTVSFILS